jgi:hypothetical protein
MTIEKRPGEGMEEENGGSREGGKREKLADHYH